MATPAIYDIKYYNGDTFSLVVYPKSASNTAFDLSNYTSVTFDISTKRGTSDSSRFKALGEAVIKQDSGSVLCTINPAVGALLTSDQTYVYDITIKGSGTVGGTEMPLIHTLLTGSITVMDSVDGSTLAGA